MLSQRLVAALVAIVPLVSAAACVNPCYNDCVLAVWPKGHPDLPTVDDCSSFVYGGDLLAPLPDYAQDKCSSPKAYLKACSCIGVTATQSATVSTTASETTTTAITSSDVSTSTISSVSSATTTEASETASSTVSASTASETTTASVSSDVDTTTTAPASSSTTAELSTTTSTTTTASPPKETQFTTLVAVDAFGVAVDAKFTLQTGSPPRGYVNFNPNIAGTQALFELDPTTNRLFITLADGTIMWANSPFPTNNISGEALNFRLASDIATTPTRFYTTCVQDAEGYLTCASEGGQALAFVKIGTVRNVYVAKDPPAAGLSPLRVRPSN